MAKVRFSPRALQDVEDIASYTLEKWGERQAAVYLDRLHDAWALLAARPELGTERPALQRPGIRFHPSGSHVIAYRVDDLGVLVLRILHGRMDAGRHLVEGED